MKANVTIQDVRNVNNQVKQLNKTLGGCISNILRLDSNGLEKQEKTIIDVLLCAKKSTEIYKLLAEKVKPHYKSGNYNNYSVINGARAIIDKVDFSLLVEAPAKATAKKTAKK